VTNFETIMPAWSTPNHDRADHRCRCTHCDNYAWVSLDSAPDAPEYAGPCPQCWRGRQVDAAQFDGFFWRDCRSLATSTWEGGLTYRHKNRCSWDNGGNDRPCGQAAIDVYCNHHAVESNRIVKPKRRFVAPQLRASGHPMDPAANAERRERTLNRLDRTPA